MFPSPTGGPISPDSVLHMLHRVLKRAGLPRVRFHDLRHTFATLALQNGVDIKTVSGMLGHFSRRVHPGHLRPRDYGSPARGGQGHGKSSDGSVVNSPKSLPKARGPGGGNTASGPFLTRLGHGLGHLGVQEMGTSPKVAKGQRKTPLSGWKAVFLWLRGQDSNLRPPGYEAVSSTNRSHFGSDLCFLPPFARRIFHCLRPALPVPIPFWVKTGSRS